MSLRRIMLVFVSFALFIAMRIYIVTHDPGGLRPLWLALEGHPLLLVLFTIASFGCGVVFATFAISLSLYQRQRAGDLMPGWIFWMMALGLAFTSASYFARGIAVVTPIYWVWAIFDLIGMLFIGASMTGYPFALRRLAHRRSLTELEATVERLERAIQDAQSNKTALGEVQTMLAELVLHLDSAAERAETLTGEMDAIALQLELIQQREGNVYADISNARTSLTEWQNGKAAA